jgi:hypothetical protein
LWEKVPERSGGGAIARAAGGLEGKDRLQHVATATFAARGASRAVSRRNSPGPASADRASSSAVTLALPLKVAKCQERPNRFRQWLSATKSGDNSAADRFAQRRVERGKPGFRSFPVAFLRQQARPVQHGGISSEFCRYRHQTAAFAPAQPPRRLRKAACAAR